MKQRRPAQPHLPGLSRSDRKPTVQRRSEKVLQSHIRQVLAGLGYQTLETGTGRPHIKCEKCEHSFVPTGYMGNSLGTPDLLAYRYVPGYPPIFIPLEVKGEGTVVSPEQQAMAANGRYPLVRSVEEAVRAVLAAEEAIGAYHLREERSELIGRFLVENHGRLA